MAIASELYSGAAEFGRFQASLFLIIAFVLGFIMICGGIYLLLKKSNWVKIPNANVTNLEDCKINAANTYNCTLDVTFTYNGNEMNKQVTYVSQTAPAKTMTIYYDPSSDKVNFGDVSYKFMGTVLIVMAIIFVLVAYLGYYVTQRYKFAAAGEGVAGAINMLRR